MVGAKLFNDHIWGPKPEIISITWDEQEIKLLSPNALGLLLLIPLVPAVMWFTMTDFPVIQKIANGLLRVALIIAIVAALTRPSISRFDSTMCVVYLVDVSESVPDEVIQQARDAVQQGWDDRGENDNLVRLVTFADRPEIIPIPPGTAEIPSISRHEGEGAGLASNPAAALRLSYGLCPQDYLKRVVLISDGNQNRGDLAAEAATAEEFGVRVYSHEIPFEPQPEILVRDLEMPDDIDLSEPFRMVAEIYSNVDTTATYSLTQNEFRDIRGREVELTRGINRIEMEAEVYEPGFRRFEFRITPEGDDRFDENNVFTRTVTVEGRPRVLYVEGESRSRQLLAAGARPRPQRPGQLRPRGARHLRVPVERRGDDQLRPDHPLRCRGPLYLA